MNFQFAIEAENVRVLNPGARLALCTLWTPPGHVEKTLADLGVDLSPAGSPLALIGGLFGGGLKVMLRNLLYNPQIEQLVVFGRDHSGAGEHLVNFFRGRVRRTGQKQWYRFADGSRKELEKVAVFGGASTYIMDELVLPEMFCWPPEIVTLGFSREALAEFMRGRRPAGEPAVGRNRLKVELPEPEVDFFPSDRFSQVVAAETILEAWPEVLFRLSRFGEPVSFRGGKQRRELLNLKVVISRPADFQREQLALFNLSWPEIEAYQAELLEPGLGPYAYTYGNRLRAHFKADLLAGVISDLSQAGDSRRGFVTLWDNSLDLGGRERPCLTALFFRKIDGLVHLSAVFRSHNATRAWPRNCFGLVRIMRHVCQGVNRALGRTETQALEPGRLTVLSLSISVDPQELDQVRPYIDDYQQNRPKLARDPHGYLCLTLDRATREIVVKHYNHQDEPLAEYRGRTPAELAWRLERLAVVSGLGHALYLGGQLERAYYCLNHNLEYVQDKKIIKLDGQSP